MSTGREVWFAEEAYISIYLENGDGSYQASATLDCLYVQHVSVKNATQLIVDGQPGASAQDIYSIPTPFDVSIGDLFWQKSSQWTPFLDSTKRWRVAISNINSYYDGVTQVNDSIVLRNAAVATAGLTWQQNQPQNSGLDFRAESVE